MLVGVPMGFIATWMIDKLGLCSSLTIGAWLQCFGAFFRIISAIENVPFGGKLIFLFLGKYNCKCCSSIKN